MATKKGNSIAAENLELYRQLVATLPTAELKGDSIPYTSHNGHMFSNMDSEGNLGLRLPPDAIDAFLKKYKSSLLTAFGIVSKEYVSVPQSLLQNTNELQPYFAQSFAYVNSLKPKATKKKK